MKRKREKAGKKPAKAKKLNVRRERFKTELLAGKTQMQAALDAGYSPSTAKSNASEMAASVRGDLIDEIQKQGGTAKYLAEKLLYLTNAQTVRWNPNKNTGDKTTETRGRGKNAIEVEVPILGGWDAFADGHLQLAAVQEINKIRAAYPREDDDRNLRPIEIVFPASFTNIAIGVETNGKDS